MSFVKLVELDDPALAPAQAHLRSADAAINQVKVFKQRCSDTLEQCALLLMALQRNIRENGSLTEQVTAMMEHLDEKVSDWAALSPLQSFLCRQDIKQGIQDVRATMLEFDVPNLDFSYPQALRERDETDIRDLLQVVVGSTTEMHSLLNMQSEQAVHEVMETLQTELYDPRLVEHIRKSFAQALWVLHEQTNKLPPLADLTGQVKLNGAAKDDNIYLGEWLGTEQVELRVPRSLPNNSDVRKRYQREVEKWRHLKDANVISLYGIAYNGRDLFIVQPWMSNGNAIEFVQKNPEVDRLKILTEIASGLEYLHKEMIVHGDLRGANVLIDANGTALLSGFGTASFIEAHGNNMAFSNAANPRWFAPELLRNSGAVSTQSDVWSFAMVCLELMTGQPPYSNIPRDDTVLRELEHGKIPERPGRAVTGRGLSDELWALMCKCWHKKPESRPSAATVKSRLLHLRGLGLPSQKKAIFSLRRPRTSSKPFSEDLHLRVPSMASSRLTATPVAALAVDHFEPGAPRSPPSHSDVKLSFSSDDRSTPTLFPDTDSDLQSTRSGSSQYSLSHSMIVHVTPISEVSAGSLEGLVDRLLSPDAPNRSEFREVMLSTCHDFTTPDNILAIIIQRFHEAGHNTEASETLQSNVFAVLAFWLSNNRLQVHPPLLSAIKQFCLSVSTNTSSMQANARSLLHLVEERARVINTTLSPTTPSSTKIPRTADILPRDLAIALALLEGDKYRSIIPADYISHLRKIEGPNNVDAASLENNRIGLFVKKSVLTPSRVETRAEVLKFFVNTAHECRKLRNFASLSAITNALQSTPIERLTLTVGALSPHLRDRLQDLKNLLDPSNNHLTYRTALKPEQALDPEYKDFCIPWLAVHLRDLHSLLRNYPPNVEIDGCQLINFRRYSKFMEHVRGILLFKPPDLERYRHNGQLAYLQHQLRGVHFDPDADVALMQRSLELEADETRIHRTRALELKRLGFRSS